MTLPQRGLKRALDVAASLAGLLVLLVPGALIALVIRLSSPHMSLVGPRPDVPGYADRLEGNARRLLELRPGITGPATLHFRDEETLLAATADPQGYNDTVIWPKKVQLNLAYLDHWSLWTDIRLIVETLLPRSRTSP